jgi:Leucine-rich repeat (LRR) protein
MLARGWFVSLFLLAAACETLVTDSETASFSLNIIASGNSNLSEADQGWVRIRGPQIVDRQIVPGETVTIDNLTPGTYSVYLEGLSTGEVVEYGERQGVTVAAGQTAQVTITTQSFVPAIQSMASTVEAGSNLSVQFSAVPGATGYTVEVADNPDFNGAATQDGDGTTISVPMPDPGTFYVRVRARSQFGLTGQACSPQVVEVTEPDPALVRDQAALAFVAVEGNSNPPDQTLQISNGGGGTLSWSVADDAEWLSLSPQSGTSTGETDDVTVSVDITDLSRGTYTATITVTGEPPATGSPQTTSVTLEVEEPYPALAMSPPKLSFDAVEGGSQPDAKFLEIKNRGGRTLSWHVTSDAAWLTLDPTDGTSTGETDQVIVSVDISGLAADTFHATITATADSPATGSPQTMPVRLVVAPPGSVYHSLTAEGEGDGNGSVTSNPAGINCTSTAGAESGDCTEDFLEDTEVTLTATPSGGSTFTGWSGACTGTGACVVTMDQQQTVTATFTLVYHTLTVNGAGDGAGQVVADKGAIDCTITAGSVSGTCSDQYADNKRVTLTATPYGGSSFSGWGGACTGNGACEVTMDDAKTVTATFTLVYHTLTVNGAGFGSGQVEADKGAIDCTITAGATSGTCSDQYTDDKRVTLAATPSGGSTFGGWGDACAGTEPCEVTMDAAKTVTATFDLGTFSDCSTQSAIPTLECEALVVLYDETNGPGWTNSAGWLADPNPCNWHGVSCSGGSVSHLNLWDNQLAGPIPSELGNLAGLQNLTLVQNPLTGTLPPELGNLSNLVQLWIAETQITGEIPTQFGNLGNLGTLYLYSNQLSGTIPTELANISNLEALSLGRNQLSGEIPSVLGTLSDLRVLTLPENQLTGSLPSSLGGLQNLLELNAYSNLLSGEIPPELGNMGSLESLSLHSNQFSGQIPSALGALAGLRNLSLSYNDLTGPVPGELGGLVNLEFLSVKHNQLSGLVPLSVAENGGRIQNEHGADRCELVPGNSGLSILDDASYRAADLDGDGFICGLAFPPIPILSLTHLW